MGFYALTFWFGGKLVAKGEIEFRQMMKAIFALAFAASGAGQAAAFAGDQAKATAAREHIMAMLDRVPSVPNDPWGPAPRTDQVIPGDRFKGALQFQNVRFTYPTRIGVSVLEGLSLSVQPGQMVAFVGMSGSGKSTIIQLLERFYDPVADGAEKKRQDESTRPTASETTEALSAVDREQTGCILLDGVDLRDLDGPSFIHICAMSVVHFVLFVHMACLV